MKKECRVFITQIRYEHSTWSGLRDLNPRSLGPKPSAIPNFAKPGWIRFWRSGKCNRHFSDGMVVLRTARWFFRTAWLFFSARGSVRPQVLPLEGKVSPQATEEVSYRIAVSFDGCKNGTKITSSVIRLAGDAGCHPPRKGRDFARSPFRRTQKRNEFHQVLPLEGKVSP